MTQHPDFVEFYLAHPEKFDPLDWNAPPSESRAETTLAAPAPAPAPAPPPDRVSLAQWQTPTKNQLARGACYAFAAVAAMEAAYLRDHGVTLDLSEQYAFHMNMSSELLPEYMTMTRQYENNSCYWGFRGNSGIVALLASVAIPDEQTCPYLDQPQLTQVVNAIGTVLQLTTEDTQPPTQAQVDRFEYDERVLPQAAARAARYRVASYFQLPDVESGTIESVLASGHEVVADIPGHCLLVVGYDRPMRQWLVKDSANPGSLQTMPYDAPGIVPPEPWILGGHVVTAVHPPSSAPQPSAWWLGRWAIDGAGLAGELVVRRTAYYRERPPGSPTKVGTYIAGGAEYDVTGQLEADGSVLRIWIASAPGKVIPGTKAGTELVFVTWSSAPDEAVEQVPPDRVATPARLRRLPLPENFKVTLESKTLSETVLASGVASFPVLTCPPQDFRFSTVAYDEEFVIRVAGLAPGVVVTWSVGGVEVATGPSTQRVDVRTDPASPAGLGPTGLVEHAPSVVSVEAVSSADTLTLRPASVGCWLQVTASAPGYVSGGVRIIVRGTVQTVDGLEIAEQACLATTLGDIIRTREHVKVVVLDDPEYSDLDPGDKLVLDRLEADQLQTVMERRRLVAEMTESAPEQARALAESTELVYRLRRGFMSS